ncbi:class I SAM-dependent RNA methyltransferase [Nocardia puris]|uniref:tRNA (Uracil-5-)-methyltransferase n=1 Tax=Nocardia puris TaxID=208602 RepID=A0A366E279_9NOCA|nr:TRAM domain-containing protein [Nocardia puris]RBO96407.1 tRNA (uracil-5-)-methyltransferase [Nocardia puris]
MSGTSWYGRTFEIRLGPPGHGGFCVGRHEGRVVFVRHGLPGELVRALVTEDRGGSFCRADAVEILEASVDRVPSTCPVSGPGGAGCCDFAHATPAAQRALKAAVVEEQLRRVTRIEREVVVEPVAGYPADASTGWRTRVRLPVDAEGRAGMHRYRSASVIPDLRCPQPVPRAMDGLADRLWTPGADLVVTVDGDGVRHVVEVAPAETGGRGGRSGRGGGRAGRAAEDRRGRGSADRGSAGHGGRGRGGADGERPGSSGRGAGDSGSGRAGGSRPGRAEGFPAGPGRRDRPGGERRGDEPLAAPFDSGSASGGSVPEPGGGEGVPSRRQAMARRAAAHADRVEYVIEGTGRAVEYVAGRRWEVSSTGFWQAHRLAAQCYSDVVADWAGLSPGARAWDLYSGAGVFAARLAEAVGRTGAVLAVESARPAVADGHAALRDLPWVDLRADRVERWIGAHTVTPDAVVLDPPRAGAGRDVITALTAAAPDRIVHIGCDPASFARDLALYIEAGYRLSALRAFDAFPSTHHVECLALLER